MRRCPLCAQPMHVLQVKKVELDWCGDCRSLWFDRGELTAAMGLTGAPTMTKEHPACRCPACAASATRSGMLWFSRIDGTEVLACVDCAGCFVSQHALERRGVVASSGLDAKGVCQACGDTYPVAKLLPTPAGLTCVRCVPPAEPDTPPRSTLLELLDRLRALLGGTE